VPSMTVDVSAFTSEGVSEFEHGLPGLIVWDVTLETGSLLVRHGDVNHGGLRVYHLRSVSEFSGRNVVE